MLQSPVPMSRRLRIYSVMVLAAATAVTAACDSKTTDLTNSTPIAPRTSLVNPFAGQSLWVDSTAAPFKQLIAWRSTRPADAAKLERIALQPNVPWYNEIDPATNEYVDDLVTRITAAGKLPVFVLYAIPHRDCGLYSAGGAANGAQYLQWIDKVVQGIGSRRAVVLLEPDAINEIECLTSEQLTERLEAIRGAVAKLKKNPLTFVYIDAGNPGWEEPRILADRLTRAGIEGADGFMLNVSNFVSTADNIVYGKQLSALLGGIGFIIDTSRNGNGPAPNDEWCNPAGRALGQSPSTNTGDPLVHAFLWVKTPGESDGTCNGGPASGEWWSDYAMKLIAATP